MGYKLGGQTGTNFDGGTVKTKLSFGMGVKDQAIPGNPIEYVVMEERGMADMDGTIYINEELKGTRQHDITLNHEMVHMTDMKLGKLAYNDYCITYNGKKHPRSEDGRHVQVDNKWYEVGDKKNLPWEKKANI